jgi:predicted alpha/beta hydrolase family esterase
MNHASIIHGWGADSTSNWFPWLAQELQAQEWEVAVPDFPNSQNPVLEEWLEYYDTQVSRKILRTAQDEGVNSGRIARSLIGHSLGVPFILRLLEQTNDIYDTAYLVAGFERPLGIPEIEHFVDKPFQWDRIRKQCKKFMVINSDNDPYISLDIGEELAKKLKITLIIEPNGDHLSAPGGVLAYPRLLEMIESAVV